MPRSIPTLLLASGNSTLASPTGQRRCFQYQRRRTTCWLFFLHRNFLYIGFVCDFAAVADFDVSDCGEPKCRVSVTHVCEFEAVIRDRRFLIANQMSSDDRSVKMSDSGTRSETFTSVSRLCIPSLCFSEGSRDFGRTA